jgi:3-oxoacyl-[acyl-carrier protein] reductase
VLVNNAGNMYRGPLAELDEQSLIDVFHSNVVGAMMLTQAALDHLVEAARCGDLRRVGALAAGLPGRLPVRGHQGGRRDPHRGAGRRARPARRARVVHPTGRVFTELNQRAGLFDDATALARLEGLAPAHALGRLGTVTEIAEGIEYLARAEWVTGNVLTVDGGLGLGVTNA